VTRKVLSAVIGAAVCMGVLSGCSAISGTTIGQAQPISQGDTKAVPDDPKPTAEGTESVPPGGPGFVDDSKGAPVVKRDKEKPASAKVKAGGGGFESTPANYSDGVLVSVGGLRGGVVTATGPGSIAGASYVSMDIKIQNGSNQDLAVSSVVVTLRYGKGNTAAASLYEGANELDFAGTVKAGESQTRKYAFMIPKGTDAATIFVDIDGAHTPAVLSGKLPL
jgi:Domain of unknown function (DUF4352)